MTEAEQIELNRRVKEIVERFEKSPQLQNEIIDELKADGVIDNQGQVILLRNGNHRDQKS